MQKGQQVALIPRLRQPRHNPVFGRLFRGYRFTACTSDAAVSRALEVRRQVYVERCGYEVPVPDSYDGRSWALLVEHVRSGEAVGSMRITPKWAGPLEAEEYFELPWHLKNSPCVVEMTRFAVLTEARREERFFPVVGFGLFILVGRFLERFHVQHAIVCSKPERVWTYEWLKFRRTGLRRAYGKLANAEHELLTCDLRRGSPWRQAYADGDTFPYADAFEMDHPEIIVPDVLPSFSGPMRDTNSPSGRRWSA